MPFNMQARRFKIAERNARRQQKKSEKFARKSGRFFSRSSKLAARSKGYSAPPVYSQSFVPQPSAMETPMMLPMPDVPALQTNYGYDSNIDSGYENFDVPGVPMKKDSYSFTNIANKESFAYPASEYDNQNYWNSEMGYLGAAAAVDAAANVPQKSWYEKLIDVYGLVAAQRTAQKYQNQLAAENSARAKSGRPPIDIESYITASSPRVNFGLSPAVQNILIYGGIGLAAVFLLPKLLKK